MSTKPCKVHPAADAFPMMNAAQYEGLKSDIAAHGQQEAIVYWKGMLVDGRNRLKACQELKIEPTECELDEDTDPVTYIISANLHRRHLTTAQRSMVAAKLANMTRGKPSKEDNVQNCTLSEAAKLLQVSDRSVNYAKHVVANGSKELVQAVERGEVNLNQATKLVKAMPDKREQTKIVGQGKEAIKAAVASPKVKPPQVEPEKTAEAVDNEPDDYDYPIVKAFSQCDYRLNTLRKIIDGLSKSELAVLKDWLS